MINWARYLVGGPVFWLLTTLVFVINAVVLVGMDIDNWNTFDALMLAVYSLMILAAAFVAGAKLYEFYKRDNCQDKMPE